MNPSIDAVVPAAGRIDGEFAGSAGSEIKALIALDGRTVLEHTLRALHATSRINRIVVVGPRGACAAGTGGLADAVLDEGATGIENVYRGLDWLRDNANGGVPRRILILTSDLPYLTPEAITGLLNATSHTADISVPVIERCAFDARFPGAAREFVRLRDGEWTIGCGFVADPDALQSVRPHVERIFDARKSQVRMARLLGLPFVLRFATHRATVADVVARCSAILGTRGEAVRGCAPELAFDIDGEEDWRYAAGRRESQVASRE
jgi:CTP:molybdopterin cytidylyltransferase MocA